MGGFFEVIVLVLIAAFGGIRWQRRSQAAEVERATDDWIDYLVAECPSLQR
jgi:hypothetical protein